MLRYVREIFPGFRSARRALAASRPQHFRLLGSLFGSPREIFEDLPETEIRRINEASQLYFEKSEQREYWSNKPFSDPMWAPWFLWRFGLLLSGVSTTHGERILDFGCGSGWTTIMLARMGANVVGMDIAPTALKLAEEVASKTLSTTELSRIRFQVFEGSKIDAPDESFDSVLVFEAFHHFPNPKTLLHEFCRILSPHGSFGFAEPGVGHSVAELSHEETEHGILEQDLDLELLYTSGVAAGFRDLEIFVPAISPRTFTLSMTRARWFLRGISWFLPADLFRAAILTAPIGMFRKSPYSITSLHPGLQLAKIRPARISFTISAGDEYEIPVQVKNKGNTVWLKESGRGYGYVRLGAHLLNMERRVLDFDYGRAALSVDIMEEQTARMTLRLRAPNESGTYKVQLDMVNEGVCWFAQTGSPAAEITLVVRSSV